MLPQGNTSPSARLSVDPDSRPRRQRAPSITLSHAEREGIQELHPEIQTQPSNSDVTQQTAPHASQPKGSVLPSSPARSTYGDDTEWDEVFPETITCTLTLFEAVPRRDDQAPSSNSLIRYDPEPIQWYKHDAYEALKKKQEEFVKRAFCNIGTKDFYIRYGLCRVVGKKHESCKKMEDLFQLRQTAITLICGFIRDHDHEIFSVEISWEYATKQVSPRQSGMFANTIRNELGLKMLKNYWGKEYISREDLIKIMDANVVRQIIEEDEDAKKWSDNKREDFFRKVQRKASRLQAVCVKQNLTMGFLDHLLEYKLDDLHANHASIEELMKRHHCDREDCEANRRDFRRAYYAFFPHKLDKDYLFREFSVDAVIPLYESKLGSLPVGHGAASTVYQVNIDPVQHTLSTDRRSAFALKQFNVRASAAFQREQAMIKKLALRPHEHITPYLAMWTQSRFSYILFPLAKYNLRDFMQSTPQPQLTANFVLWFLGQLEGLASAVDHFHWMGKERSPDDDDSAVSQSGDYHRLGADLIDQTQDRRGLAGFHHDIKCENILIFGRETTQEGNSGIFKLTDFGAGRFAELRFGEPSKGVSGAKGTLTYVAPDKHPSRPYDLWGLGCVFIELLSWALTSEQDGGLKFASRRYCSEPEQRGAPHPDDAFWYHDFTSKEDKLRTGVRTQLDDLKKKYSHGMKAFQKVAELTEKLFTIKPLSRPKAPQVVQWLAEIVEEAREELKTDPNCYLRDHNERSDSLSAAYLPAEIPHPSELGLDKSDPGAVTNEANATKADDDSIELESAKARHVDETVDPPPWRLPQ